MYMGRKNALCFGLFLVNFSRSVFLGVSFAMQAAAVRAPPQPSEKEDGGEGSQRSVKKFRSMKRSFAETAAGPARFAGDQEKSGQEGDWFDEGIAVDSDDEDDGSESQGDIPVVKLPKALRKELVDEWKNALIVKFLGKPVAFQIFYHRLMRICGIKGKLDLIDVGYNCYVARFEDVANCKHVLFDGPWKLFDNYIVTQRWRPDFDPKSSKMEKMAVWVRLPGLPVEYFREDVIRMILEHVGTPLKLDKTTVCVERGRFARATVEIDLSKPLVSKVLVRKRVQVIEFEGLHVFCFTCGQVGHRSEHCSERTKAADAPMADNMDMGVESKPEGMARSVSGGVESEKYGPWMLVNRKQRKPVTQVTSARRNSGGPSVNHSNKFGVLAVAEDDSVQVVGTPSGESGDKPCLNEGKVDDSAGVLSKGESFLLQELDGLPDAPIWSKGKGGLVFSHGRKGRGRGGFPKRQGDRKVATPIVRITTHLGWMPILTGGRRRSISCSGRCFLADQACNRQVRRGLAFFLILSLRRRRAVSKAPRFPPWFNDFCCLEL